MSLRDEEAGEADCEGLVCCSGLPSGLPSRARRAPRPLKGVKAPEPAGDLPGEVSGRLCCRCARSCSSVWPGLRSGTRASMHQTLRMHHCTFNTTPCRHPLHAAANAAATAYSRQLCRLRGCRACQWQ